MTSNNYARIPDEMRMYAQWCVWRYEDEASGKPTKVPYSARTGKLASVTDPTTWATFDEAVSAAKGHGWYSGVGFILSENDPYSFIDLDDPYAKNPDGSPKHAKPEDILDRQLKVFNEFNSYAERSPSGKGLHVIVKGKVPSGRRRSAIEVYSKERYMTMTGDVYRDLPIHPFEELLTQLWSQMGGTSNNGMPVYNAVEQREDDIAVFTRAVEAANGDKFKALYEGRWQDLYPSQSEADLALVDMIAFYTQNRDQIKRMFLSSELGKRDKAKRVDYMNYMLAKCFDRMLPPIDVDGLRNAMADRLAVLRAKPVLPESVVPPPSETSGRQVYEFPPGLVGELATFLHDAAPRPVPEIALAGSIGFLAGILGRSYNVSSTGLNQYVLLLAPTGTGKEAINSGIDRLTRAVLRQVPSIVEFVGPAEISSAQALIKYLAKTAPSFVSVLGEFGLLLSQMSSDYAASHMTSLKRILLDVYAKSGHGQTLRPMIYSDKEKNTNQVESPAVTLLGESTPETFYGALNEEMIANGLLPRILTIEYKGKRPPLNQNHSNVQPSFQLSERIATIASHSLQLNSQNKVIEVALTPEGKTMFDGFDRHCDQNINSADREVRRHLWNRAHIKALKLAALVSVGLSPYRPVIDEHCADWAIRIVVADVRNLLARFDAGEIGIENDETRQLKKVIDAAAEWLTKPWSEVESYDSGTPQIHAERFIPYSYLQRRLGNLKEFKKDRRGATESLNRALKTLEERGDFQQVGRVLLQSAYGTTARCYMVKNVKLIRN